MASRTRLAVGLIATLLAALAVAAAISTVGVGLGSKPRPPCPPVSKPVSPPVSKPVSPPVSKPVSPPVCKPSHPGRPHKGEHGKKKDRKAGRST